MSWSRKLALLVPVVLVNAMAVWGQGGWAFEHLTNANGPEDVAVALLFAASVESIGVYLAWEAHAALMADQAAGLLRAGSYGVGVLVGVLNYAHFADDGRPTAQAVTFGLLSAISPWLWAIRSRSLNRGRLAELDMIDERGLKLSTNRKFWHPIKSLRVTRWAAWSGVTKPADAVSGWEASRRGDVFDVGPLELARAANAALAAALESDTDDDTATVPDGTPDELSTAGQLPDESAGGTPSGVALPPDTARKIARALKAFEPDMSADMIAPLVGRSSRTVERYLNGHVPTLQ
jgi:hypothetical protein